MPVHDLSRATIYYRDVLGLPFLFSAPQLAFFDCAGVRLMLSVPEAPEAGLECVARLPTHDLWLAFFDDPEGNTLALMSEV